MIIQRVLVTPHKVSPRLTSYVVVYLSHVMDTMNAL